MRYCRKKKISQNKFIQGFYAPYELEFTPFADVNELCEPCYRWRFLELIRGSNPRWSKLLNSPFGNPEIFNGFCNQILDFFRKASNILMRMLSRSTYPEGIINNLYNNELVLRELDENATIELYHPLAMEFVIEYLRRLHRENILTYYIDSRETLFNLHVINEDFNLFREERTLITLTQLEFSDIGLSHENERNRETFEWKGTLPVYGTIPIIHLERREIRVPVPIANNSFDPPIDFSNTNIVPEGLQLFLIDKEFHKMWILRESLSQLIEIGKYQPVIRYRYNDEE